MDEFIKVTKDGETIEIHPLALDDHKRLGWKVVGESVTDAEAVTAEESENKDGTKSRVKRRIGTTIASADKEA